jgi:hypothetical protein
VPLNAFALPARVSSREAIQGGIPETSAGTQRAEYFLRKSYVWNWNVINFLKKAIYTTERMVPPAPVEFSESTCVPWAVSFGRTITNPLQFRAWFETFP